MLVLSRKQGESIRIGDNIEITIVRVAGKRIRIGITAPKDVVVTRPQANELASEPSPDQPGTDDTAHHVVSFSSSWQSTSPAVIS